MIRLDAGFHLDSGLRLDAVASPVKKQMNKILRHWMKLGRGARVAFCRIVANNLAKTPPPLANPNPPLAEYEAAVVLAETKIAELQDLEQQVSAKRLEVNDAVDAVSAATEKMARRTEDVHGENAAAIVEVGFQLASSTAQPPATMTAPEELAVTPGDSEGELDWQVRPVAGASGYEARTTATPTVSTSWTPHTVITRSSGTITGLPSGTRQYVQIRAIGPNGPGPWSDVASKMVP